MGREQYAGRDNGERVRKTQERGEESPYRVRETEKGRLEDSGALFLLARLRELAGDHFGVDFGDSGCYAEAPGEDGVGFEFFGDDVLVGGV
jgi:hypothetical protein